MILESNIFIDNSLNEKNITDTLTFLDKLKLALANFAARLFPLVDIYTYPQQEGVIAPAVFIDFYTIFKQRRLKATAQYEIGFTISYIAMDAYASTEIENALLLIEQNITDIEGYAIQSLNSDITDGISNVTGIIKIGELNLPDGEIIQKTAKEFIL